MEPLEQIKTRAEQAVPNARLEIIPNPGPANHDRRHVTAPRAIEDLLRDLAPRVLAGLVRRYGDFANAEDAVQEALLAAAAQWPTEGFPDNPRAWLLAIGTRRLTDIWRSDEARRRRERLARTVAPLLEEARRTLELNAAGSGGTGLLRYGSRIGDLQGLGAATLSLARFRSPTTAVPTALRALGGALALYGLTRRGTLGAMLRTLGTGMLVGAAGRTVISGSPVPALDRRRQTLFPSSTRRRSVTPAPARARSAESKYVEVNTLGSSSRPGRSGNRKPGSKESLSVEPPFVS